MHRTLILARITLGEIADSLERGLPRIAALALVGVVNVLLAKMPELAGWIGGPMPILAPLAMGTGLAFLGLAAADFAVRIVQPSVDAQRAATHAIATKCTASAIVYAGRCFLIAALMLLVATASRAEQPPAAALPLLPVLKSEQLAHWPAMPLPSVLGAQVDKETCITPRHRSCWNPRAELRTSREQGIGLAQLTRSWSKTGALRFDALAEIRAAFPQELAGLTWSTPYDPRLQLRALVLKDRQTFERVLATDSIEDRLAMMLAAYNGGAGGLASDRRMCAATKGCDPGRWFGHVERTSLKAQTAIPGYGQSFYAINRAYVREILLLRRARYLELEGDADQVPA